MGKQWKVTNFIFGAPKSLQMVTAAMKLKDTPWKKNYYFFITKNNFYYQKLLPT